MTSTVASHQLDITPYIMPGPACDVPLFLVDAAQTIQN